MEFRHANLDDIDRLRELEQGVIDAERPFNRAIKTEGAIYYDLPALLTGEQSAVLVAEHDNRIVATGYIDIRVSKPAFNHPSHGYLGFMFVDPEHRGKGLNQAIIDQLIKWGQDKGVYDFYLDVYADNESAVRAYEKVGFQSSIVEMKLHTQPN